MRFFRLTFTLILCGALLAAMGCQGATGASSSPKADTSKADSSHADTSGADSSGAASSGMASSTASVASSASSASVPSNAATASSKAPGKPFDVDAAVRAAGLSAKADVSACFPKDAAGYLVNGGPYLVDAETIVRLTTAKVEGTGSVKWKDYQIKSAMAGARAFDGVIPVSKLNDPIYTCMNLPAEAEYFEGNLTAGPSWGPFGGSWNNRINGFNMTPVDDDYTDALCMGAIAPALDKNRQSLLDPEEEFTLCISNFITLYHSTAAGLDWTVAQKTVAPPASSVNHFYALPWSSNTSLNKTVPSSLITIRPDHTEVKLKGSDFIGNGDDIQGYVYHYWDKRAYFSKLGVTGGQIDGIVLSVTIWVKEAKAANKLIGGISADIRPGKSGSGAQLNNGRPCLIPATPRILVSHSVGPNSAYDSIMDSEKVQKLLGMK